MNIAMLEPPATVLLYQQKYSTKNIIVNFVYLRILTLHDPVW